MAGRFSIDEKTYAYMLELLHTLSRTDKRGAEEDLAFIYADYWLQDTAVIDHVVKHRGNWDVHLVFAHHEMPLKLIKRRIKSFSTKFRAEQSAYYMRKLAAKDQRGTLCTDPSKIKINLS